MKFYGGNLERVGLRNYGLSQGTNENDLYEDFLKLASYYEVTDNFENIKEALKSLSIKGQDDALAFYLFNVDVLDDDMRKQALFMEKYADKSPIVLKIIAGLHLHDNVEFDNKVGTVKQLIRTIKSTENLIVSLSLNRFSDMLLFPYNKIHEEREQLKILYSKLNETEYADCLRKAQLAYFEDYEKNKNISQRNKSTSEYLNLRYFSPASDMLKYVSGADVKYGTDLRYDMLKNLNRSLKNSQVDKEFYLPYAYDYCSLISKDKSKFGVHSRSILKSISKLPLKTENIEITSTKSNKIKNKN